MGSVGAARIETLDISSKTSPPDGSVASSRTAKLAGAFMNVEFESFRIYITRESEIANCFDFGWYLLQKPYFTPVEEAKPKLAGDFGRRDWVVNFERLPKTFSSLRPVLMVIIGK
jgi:hypothetical protein